MTISRSVEKVEAEKRNYINFNKADWAAFTGYSESCFENMEEPSNILKDENKFRTVLTEAKRRYIPAGYIPKIIPYFPNLAAQLTEERDLIRTTTPNSPIIQELNVQISKLVDEHRRKK